jgi:hypothetical protein
MPATVNPATQRDERQMRDAQFAMPFSLIAGAAMLIGKTTIYLVTHSAATVSDAAESVVHVIAAPEESSERLRRMVPISGSSPVQLEHRLTWEISSIKSFGPRW